METSTVEVIKLAIVSATGLSKDALHIYVGLGVMFTSAAVLRKPLRSLVPWFLVLMLAVAGELVDMRDDMNRYEYWHWGQSLYDVLNTIFWPTVLMLFAWFGMFGISTDHNA